MIPHYEVEMLAGRISTGEISIYVHGDDNPISGDLIDLTPAGIYLKDPNYRRFVPWSAVCQVVWVVP